MRTKIVTLYIDDSGVRLAVIKNDQVKKSAELRLEPGLIEGGIVRNEEEVAAQVKRLFRENKVGTGKVILGLSGRQCFTRPVILPTMPKALLPEAITRVAGTTLPLPVEQLYLSWQAMPTAEDIQVFLTGIRRQSADSVMKMLKRVGIRPYLMDIKPLALTRLVREYTAVLVDVQTAEFDIVIIANGIPQPIRTVAYPSESMPWEEKFPLIKNELDRTIKFYNNNNPERQLTTNAPMFVSGELTHRPELCRLLSLELGYLISVLPSPFSPGEANIDRYLVNVGLALKHPKLARSAGPSVATLNLLPAPYRPRPLSLVRVVAIPGTVAVIGLIVPMVILIQGVSASAEAVRGELDATNKLVAQRQEQRKDLNEAVSKLEKSVAAAVSERDKLEGAAQGFDNKHNTVNADLDAIANSLGESLNLVSVLYSGSKITVGGTAQDRPAVVSYARKLDGTGRFSDIVISRIVANPDGTISFTLTMKSGSN